MYLNNHSSLTIHDIWEKHAVEHPQKNAFIMVNGKEEHCYTYADLTVKAKSVAAYLQSLNLFGKPALLLYRQDIDFIAAFLGCLYAGVIAVPASPPEPNGKSARISGIIKDARPAVALCTKNVYELLRGRKKKLREFDNLVIQPTDIHVPGLKEDFQPVKIGKNSLAFLQYTSGSTGAPKGVMITHANLIYNQEMMRTRFGNTKSSIFVSWLPMHHNMGLIGNLVGNFYLGGTSVMLSPEDFIRTPFMWLASISKYKGTFTGSPNFGFDLCVSAVSNEQKRSLDLSSLQSVSTGGEPVRSRTIENFYQAFKECGFKRETFIPCYGLAEATLMVSAIEAAEAPSVKTVDTEELKTGRVSPGKDKGNSLEIVNCGKSCMEQEIIIVNPETLKTCRNDETGEIWLKGSNVAKGYWNRPKATEATFRAYTKDTKAGPFLRSGDLGFMADGNLYICGRRKDMIILRGKNYYPNDIENTIDGCHVGLMSNGGVAFSVAGEHGEQLILVCEVRREYLREINTDEIASVVRSLISRNFNISLHALVLIDPHSLPKTPSGKPQRKLCRSLYQEGGLKIAGTWENEMITRAAKGKNKEMKVSLTGRDEKFYTNLEKKLAFLWGGFFGLEKVDINDNFFDRGGDSLKAISLSSQLREFFKISISADDIYDFSDFSELAAHIERMTGGENDTDDEDIHPDQEPFAGEVPLLSSQRWFFGMIEERVKNPGMWNTGDLVCLMVPLVPELLKQAVEYLDTYHDALRARFYRKEGLWVQEILPSGRSVPYRVFDLKGVAKSGRERYVEKTLVELESDFSLEAGRLYLVALFVQEEGESVYLALRSHHILADAYSLNLYFADLAKCYLQLARGGLPCLPPRTLSIRQWVEKIQYYANTELLAKELVYWQSLPLKGVPRLPVDYPGGENLVASTVDKVIRLSEEDTACIVVDLAKEYKIRVVEILLAGLAYAVSRWTGAEWVYIKSVILGRDIIPGFKGDTSRTFGWLTTECSSVFRIKLSSTAGELLKDIGRQQREIPNKGCGLELIRYFTTKLSPRLDVLYKEKSQVLLNYRGTMNKARNDKKGFPIERVDGVRLQFESKDNSKGTMLLDVQSGLENQRLEITIKYSKNIYKSETIDLVARYYKEFLLELIREYKALLKEATT